MDNIGLRLRRLREHHGLSQRALGARTGTNHSTISLIEQNRISPSIGMLKRILDGIPVSLSAFFSDQSSNDPGRFAYRRSELTEIAGNNEVSLLQVGGDLSGRALQLMHERYKPFADSGPVLLKHEAEEAGVIIKGRIELTVAGRSEFLEAGDAYYFDSRLPHRFRNEGDGDSELISVCTPPSF